MLTLTKKGFLSQIRNTTFEVLFSWPEFLKGYQEEGDHHPHPDTRLIEVCGRPRNKQ